MRKQGTSEVHRKDQGGVEMDEFQQNAVSLCQVLGYSKS